jgi:hypothetical protein
MAEPVHACAAWKPVVARNAAIANASGQRNALVFFMDVSCHSSKRATGDDRHCDYLVT